MNAALRRPDPLRRLHLVVGLLALVAFPVTGLLMRMREPPLASADMALRLLFRSRHVYLMFAGATNLAFGLHLRTMRGARRALQWVGGVLVALAAPLALVGFFRDPAVGTLPGAAFGKFAALAAFGGVVLHAAARAGTNLTDG